MKKIVSVQSSESLSKIEMLDLAISNLEVLLSNKDIDPKSNAGKEVRKVIQTLVNLIDLEESLSRSSSLTSMASLGDRVAVRDKEDYLYTYPWVQRDSDADRGHPNAIWHRGNMFREWAEHPHRHLPSPHSGLNCWEAVTVLLFLYNVLSKEDIRVAYSFADFEGDSSAVNQLFGLEDETYSHKVPVQDLHVFVKTGDVLVFHSNRGSEFGHVALVLDNFEKLWIASHWSMPKEKMIRITPNRIFASSKESALERFDEEVLGVSDMIQQYQESISRLLVIGAVNSEVVDDLKKDYMSERTHKDVLELMHSVRAKRKSEQEAVSGFEIQSYEKNAIEKLYDQAQQLMESFESAIGKHATDEEILGVIHGFIDGFDQMSIFYSPLYSLEYLEENTVLVSTKFRPFFLE